LLLTRRNAEVLAEDAEELKLPGACRHSHSCIPWFRKTGDRNQGSGVRNRGRGRLTTAKNAENAERGFVLTRRNAEVIAGGAEESDFLYVLYALFAVNL
jgi:hypothetical protein